MVVFKHKGSFKSTENLLGKAAKARYMAKLSKFGQKGVAALEAATPVDSGLTAGSWGYDIQSSKGSLKIVWTNSNVSDGVPIAIIIQYGHATGNGGYVQGRDYINPAMQPIFDQIADELWKEAVGL